MKKVILMVIISLLFSGCQVADKETLTDSQYNEYKNYIAIIDEQNQTQETSDFFDVQVVVNATNKNNYRYDIVIDNPKVDMYEIKAIAKIQTEDGFTYPSIGILEEGIFSLLPNVIDKDNNIYKGINLSGISSHQIQSIPLYVTYYTSTDSSAKRITFFMEVTLHASR